MGRTVNVSLFMYSIRETKLVSHVWLYSTKVRKSEHKDITDETNGLSNSVSHDCEANENLFVVS